MSAVAPFFFLLHLVTATAGEDICLTYVIRLAGWVACCAVLVPRGPVLAAGAGQVCLHDLHNQMVRTMMRLDKIVSEFFRRYYAAPLGSGTQLGEPWTRASWLQARAQCLVERAQG